MPAMEGLLTSMDTSDPLFYTHLKAAADGDISYGTPSCTSEQVITLVPFSCAFLCLDFSAPSSTAPPSIASHPRYTTTLYNTCI